MAHGGSQGCFCNNNTMIEIINCHNEGGCGHYVQCEKFCFLQHVILEDALCRAKELDILRQIVLPLQMHLFDRCSSIN